MYGQVGSILDAGTSGETQVTNYRTKQGVRGGDRLPLCPCVYVNLKRRGETVARLKLRASGVVSKPGLDDLLRDTFGEDIGIKWVGEDHATVEV
jgi:hypothetical protein